jgi:hypothetical protein
LRTKPVAVDFTYEPLMAIVPLDDVMPALLCLTLDATIVDGVAPLVPSTSTLSSTYGAGPAITVEGDIVTVS